MAFWNFLTSWGPSQCPQIGLPPAYTANVYSQITFTLVWKLARNTKGICKCQVRQYMSKKYADLEQKLLKSKSSLLVLQDKWRNHGT